MKTPLGGEAAVPPTQGGAEARFGRSRARQRSVGVSAWPVRLPFWVPSLRLLVLVG